MNKTKTIKTTELKRAKTNKHWLQVIHSWLLPQSADLGYMPYIWLVYLLMFWLPFTFVAFSTEQIIFSVAATAVFLPLYFSTFWAKDKQLFYCIFAIWSIGLIMAIQKIPSAGVFTVYAAAFCSQFNSSKTGFTTLGIMLAMTSVAAVVFNTSPLILLPALFFGSIVGGTNIYMTQIAKKNQLIKASQEEIKKIATAAERERIARDLHDLIGHTFSVINIKSQLAQKLIGQDNHQAQQEIMEIEKISRASLSEVREVVSDYRQRDLATELVQARVLLDSLDIEVTEQVTAVETLGLNNQINTAMAYIVRELTTNIMRHAQATTCTIKLEVQHNHLILCIHDNGPTKDFIAGSGLTGITERVEQLNGHATFSINQGFSARVELPLSDRSMDHIST